MIQSPASLTEQKLSSMDIAKPMSNSYPQSAATSVAAVKSQVGTIGHNSFRPDVYRVTDGYLS